MPVQLAGDINVIHEALDVEREVRGVGTHEFFQFLTLLIETHQGPWLRLDIQFVLFTKFHTEVVHQDLIKVLASKLRVRGSCKDLEGKKMENIHW